jgi:hypothetical protein
VAFAFGGWILGIERENPALLSAGIYGFAADLERFEAKFQLPSTFAFSSSARTPFPATIRFDKCVLMKLLSACEYG